MSRHVKRLFLVTVILVVGLTVRNITWEPPPVPAVPEPRTGLECFRQGGDHDYCKCLDGMESARAAARRPTPKIPPLDDPGMRYALRHHGMYPIINADTLRCLTPRAPAEPPPPDAPPAPAAPGVIASTTAALDPQA
ncbi:MAG: hypothetical protein QOC68_3764 [Solirubrobacteraceae bacterium]|nr:hypothetical protein [Solirubrobacteraceae bacterium]